MRNKLPELISVKSGQCDEITLGNVWLLMHLEGLKVYKRNQAQVFGECRHSLMRITPDTSSLMV